ncbi:MAG: 50S ribosomal protein L6 [Oligosphaeraceae bacterium]|nr:50S ribosomal protein L6 [Oligosphaeraceae bacterium]
MSRMGNKPISLSSKVKFELKDQDVKVTGPKGSLEFSLPEGISLENDGTVIHVKRANDDRFLKMKHGMVRSIINSMIIGVDSGFKIDLELFGVGYRAQLKDRTLTLNLGYSNPVIYEIPDGVTAKVPDQTHISLESIDKQKVGEAAATIRKFRAPDAYHGKGVRFVGEQMTLKEGKTV